MKFSITLSAIIFASLMNVANSQVPPVEEPDRHELEMQEPVQEESKKKYKRSENMVELNPLLGKHTVKVGQKLRYSASVHGSVGYTASASSSDNEALPLKKNFVKYDNKQNAKTTGGDSATEYFIFDVKKVGVYEVHVMHYFRGDLEEEYDIIITVEE